MRIVWRWRQAYARLHWHCIALRRIPLPTSYDQVAYPSNLIPSTNPDRLAVLAKLHGLCPAPLETARVLEIGCGDGYNLMGMAAAYPAARFSGFDLAETAIRAGQEKARTAGLDNVTLWVDDILKAKDRIEPGSADFFIAHGVYAWVPEIVRDAVMDLCAHALARNGIAYISYNAMPGGHFRRAMRDLLLHEVDGITDPAVRLATVRRVLSAIVEGEGRSSPSVECLRDMAQALLAKPEKVLFHDELGEIFAPQFLTDVVGNAARAGLRYLADTDCAAVRDAFAGAADLHADPAEIDRRLVRTMQSEDNRNTCFFRWSLFVHADAPVSRVLDLSMMDSLWVSTSLKYDGDSGRFSGSGGRQVTFSQEDFIAAFNRIAAAQPGRIPLRDLLKDDGWRDAFLTLFANSLVNLHAGPAPFVTTICDLPETSHLARFEIGAGNVRLPRLDHADVKVDQPGLRAVLLAANGKRTVAEIEREIVGVFPPDEVQAALNGAAAIALMRR